MPHTLGILPLTASAMNHLPFSKPETIRNKLRFVPVNLTLLILEGGPFTTNSILSYLIDSVIRLKTNETKLMNFLDILNSEN
jgi:hypothetical protein